MDFTRGLGYESPLSYSVEGCFCKVQAFDKSQNSYPSFLGFKILTVLGVVSPVVLFFQNQEGQLVGTLSEKKSMHYLRISLTALGIFSGIGIPLVLIMWGCSYLAKRIVQNQFLNQGEFTATPNALMSFNTWKKMFFLKNAALQNNEIRQGFTAGPAFRKPVASGQLSRFLNREHVDSLFSKDKDGVLSFVSAVGPSLFQVEDDLGSPSTHSSVYVDAQGAIYFVGEENLCAGDVEQEAVQFLKTVEHLEAAVHFDVRQGLVDSGNTHLAVVVLSPQKRPDVVSGGGALMVKRKQKMLLDVFCESNDNSRVPYSEFFSVSADGLVRYRPPATPAHLVSLWTYNAFSRMLLYVDTLQDYSKLVQNYRDRKGKQRELTKLLSQKFQQLVLSLRGYCSVELVEQFLDCAATKSECALVRAEWNNWAIKHMINDDEERMRINKRFEDKMSVLPNYPDYTTTHGSQPTLTVLEQIEKLSAAEHLHQSTTPPIANAGKETDGKRSKALLSPGCKERPHIWAKLEPLAVVQEEPEPEVVEEDDADSMFEDARDYWSEDVPEGLSESTLSETAVFSAVDKEAVDKEEDEFIDAVSELESFSESVFASVFGDGASIVKTASDKVQVWDNFDEGFEDGDDEESEYLGVRL